MRERARIFISSDTASSALIYLRVYVTFANSYFLQKPIHLEIQESSFYATILLLFLMQASFVIYECKDITSAKQTYFEFL